VNAAQYQRTGHDHAIRLVVSRFLLVSVRLSYGVETANTCSHIFDSHVIVLQ
jgi:hypothetical protein